MSQQTAKKFDAGKLRWTLLPFEVLAIVVQVLMFGASKYGDLNWQNGLGIKRLMDAALRHQTAFLGGEDMDPESGLSHLAHAICCLMFALWMYMFKPDFDDRNQ
jgi:hypothetical protein